MQGVYDIFRDCTSKDKDPELRMSMFTMLGEPLTLVTILPSCLLCHYHLISLMKFSEFQRMINVSKIIA